MSDDLSQTWGYKIIVADIDPPFGYTPKHAIMWWNTVTDVMLKYDSYNPEKSIYDSEGFILFWTNEWKIHTCDASNYCKVMLNIRDIRGDN
jgi:hypothetical protein